MDLCHSQVLQHILLNILEWLVDENILKNTLLDLQAYEIQMTSNHLLHLYCLFVFFFAGKVETLLSPAARKVD